MDRIFGQQATAAFRADIERLAVERGDVPVTAPGQKPTASAPRPPQTLQALAAQARDHYERAIQAQKAGNWAQYGQEIEALGRVIEQMRAAGK